MTIKRKFLLYGIAVVVAFGAIAAVAGAAVHDARRDQVHATIEAIADLERSRLTDHLTLQADHVGKQVAAAGLDSALAAGDDPAVLDERLESIVPRCVGMLGAELVGDDGVVLATTPPGEGTAGLSGAALRAALSAIDLGAASSVGPAIRAPAGDGKYPQVVPVRVAGQTAAYLVATFDLGALQRLLGSDEGRSPGLQAYLVQAIGDGAEYLSDPPAGSTGHSAAVVPTSRTRSPAILAVTGPAATYDNVRDDRGTEVTAAVRHVPGTPFSLVVAVDNSTAYAAFDRAMRIGVIGFALAGILSLVALALAAHSVLRRIRKMSDSAARISAGELTTRVADRSSDELGALARAFDTMADTLVADMAQRQQVEAELAHRARHDALTGLPNRLAFEQALKVALGRRWESGGVAVLFCDLDEFKTVNDDLGHSVGDALLREVTSRLRRAVPAPHVLARFGGDEFVVLAEGLGSTTDAVEIGEAMCAELSSAVPLGGRDVFVTTSVGVAMSTERSTAETLVRDADAAMYQAKALGRARVVVHDAGIGARANNRLTMSTELHRAIITGGLTVAVQPIADLTSGVAHAMEVLVRWNHDGRQIDPSMFVMRATELDLAGALDRWVLAEACRLIGPLRGMASAEVGWLHVNVTGTSLVDETFADDVLGRLAAHRVTPSELCLEIVEDRLGGAPQVALATLDRLRNAGVRVAIDDFGTGHSSLARLRDLPVDTVKIDRSFIRELSTDPTALAITGTVIGLADRLGLEVVAEGVEHPDQARALVGLGCHLGQGYLIGVPRLVSDLVEDHSATFAAWLP